MLGSLRFGDIAGRIASQRHAGAFADATALAALPPRARTNGQVALVLDTARLYRFSSAASSGGITPAAGTGRWLPIWGGLNVVSKAVAFGDITAAGQQSTLDFDEPLTAGAAVIAYGANVTAIFDNAGDTASVTFDFGIKSGVTDAFIDGGSLNAVAKVSTPAGAGASLVGAITPSLIFNGSVNLDTLTKGAATFYLAYLELF